MSELLTLQLFKENVFNYETDKEWNYRGDLPAIVDFYADWCGPCKMVAPILDRLSKKYEGKIHVYKVDTEAEPELSGMFGIQSIPTIMFIPMKGEPQAVMGALPEKEFERVIADVLLSEATVATKV
jgi:thioredoxin